MILNNDIQSQSFTGSHFNRKLMNYTQSNLSNHISDALSYCENYIRADKEALGVCFFPKNSAEVKIRILDSVSDSFIKNKNGEMVEIDVKSSTCGKAIDKILKELKKTMDGFYKREPYDEIKVRKNKTDLAKVFPDVYGTPDELRKYGGVVDDETLRLIIKSENDTLNTEFEF